VLAGAMDRKNGAAGKPIRLLRRRRLERLGIGAEPRLDNAIAAHAIMNAARDGFNLRQFGHRSIVEVCGGQLAREHCAAPMRETKLSATDAD
jgi:hypothetical protein